MKLGVNVCPNYLQNPLQFNFCAKPLLKMSVLDFKWKNKNKSKIQAYKSF